MNKRRLLKLADLLEADAKNKNSIKFDLHDWGNARDDKELALNCGTTACAMGLAVLSGAFKRAGLTNGGSKYFILPEHGDHLGFDAAASLFDIRLNEAEFLFAQGKYASIYQKGAVGERAVAKRIRQFVAGKAHP
jgi:hypothetical protein